MIKIFRIVKTFIKTKALKISSLNQNQKAFFLSLEEAIQPVLICNRQKDFICTGEVAVVKAFFLTCSTQI